MHSFQQLMIQHHSLKKEFSINTDTHYLEITYQPEHMHIKATHKDTNQTCEGYFYESTLPNEVKEQCQRVQDLYQFLQNQKSADLQVDYKDFMFKVIRIKKERWYHLGLCEVLDKGHEEIKQQCLQKEYKRSAAESACQVWKDQLQEQNKKLKKDVFFLKKSNKILKRNLLAKQQQISRFNQHFANKQIQLPPHIFYQKRQGAENYNKLKLQVNNNCLGFSKYKINGSYIEKIIQQPAILLFENAIKKRQRISFGVKIQSHLHSNWIVFGVMSRDNFDRSFCYFLKNSIAYSGTVAVVFAQMQVLNCAGRAKKGDFIQVAIDNEIMEWRINKQIICVHMISKKMASTELYPYLMLAQPGDCVSINLIEPVGKTD